MLQEQTIEFVCLSPGEKGRFILYLEDENRNRNNGRERILKLAYPIEKRDTQEAFDEFFQSPSRVNRFSHVFEGIFAINLTDYIDVPSSSRMLSCLVEYIEENSDISFVIYAVAEDKSDAVKFRRMLPALFENSSCDLVESEFKSIYSDPRTTVDPGVRLFGY